VRCNSVFRVLPECAPCSRTSSGRTNPGSRHSTVALWMNRQSKNAHRIAEKLTKLSECQAHYLCLAFQRSRADQNSRRADGLSGLRHLTNFIANMKMRHARHLHEGNRSRYHR
jgi:hypothetical protein